jgi:cysteine desulfurase
MYREKGNHIITAVTEHKAVIDTCKRLEKEGFRVTYLPVQKDGRISLDELQAAIGDKTILISIMAANNEIGVIQPIAEIGAIAKQKGILFHTDAVQIAGKVPFNVNELKVDMASLSAHKMYGPKGVGALYVRRRNPRVLLAPIIDGGGHERGMRSGTLNVPGIVGFGEAARLAAEALETGEAERIAALRDRLLAGLRARLDGVEVNGSMERRLPGNLHVSISRAEAETLILSLGGRIAISSGAACAEAGGKGSHVLRALGLPDERIYTALRFGLGRFNDAAAIDEAIEALAGAVETARSRASATPR